MNASGFCFSPALKVTKGYFPSKNPIPTPRTLPETSPMITPEKEEAVEACLEAELAEVDEVENDIEPRTSGFAHRERNRNVFENCFASFRKTKLGEHRLRQRKNPLITVLAEKEKLNFSGK